MRARAFIPGRWLFLLPDVKFFLTGGVRDAKESETPAARQEPMSTGDTFSWGHSLGLPRWHRHSWLLDSGEREG